MPELRFYLASIPFLELSVSWGGKKEQQPRPVLQRAQSFPETDVTPCLTH